MFNLEINVIISAFSPVYFRCAISNSIMTMNHVNVENGNQVNVVNQVAAISFVGCGELHMFEMCPQNPQSVCFIRNNLYSNTYNPGWQNHPTFSWGGNQHQPEQQGMQLATIGGPPGFHQGQQRQPQLQGQPH